MPKAKRPRSPAGEAMPRIAIRLPNKMLSDLEGLGKASGRGTGDEIRRRLAASLVEDDLPLEGQRLVGVVRRLCGGDLRDWYLAPIVRDTLLAAIAKAADRIARPAKTRDLPDAVVRLVNMIAENPKIFGEWAADRLVDELEGHGVRHPLSSAAEFSKKQRTK